MKLNRVWGQGTGGRNRTSRGEHTRHLSSLREAWEYNKPKNSRKHSPTPSPPEQEKLLVWLFLLYAFVGTHRGITPSWLCLRTPWECPFKQRSAAPLPSSSFSVASALGGVVSAVGSWAPQDSGRGD